jgi:putative ABC transport system substrate-binding protein
LKNDRVNIFSIESKRLGLLRALVPGVQLIGVLVNPRFPPTEQELLELEPAAKAVDQKLFVARANDVAELDRALASFVEQRVGALLVTAAPFFDTQLHRIVDFAAEKRLPAIYQFREYAVRRRVDQLRAQCGRELQGRRNLCRPHPQGEKPADLPVMQPSKFDFVINLKTAKTLGLTVPSTLLAEADDVIE